MKMNIRYYTRVRGKARNGQTRFKICVFPPKNKSEKQALFCVSPIFGGVEVVKWIDRKGHLITQYGEPPQEAVELAERIAEFDAVFRPALIDMFDRKSVVTSRDVAALVLSITDYIDLKGEKGDSDYERQR
ncbi:MAG: hypothetical protein K2K70_01255 [Lachnospiraceae bacterium]|nr:hypothetical protein [Lachnospiraceae bacterium]